LHAEAARGATVIAVLHDLTIAARWCDRLLLIDRGRLVADGAPRDVLTAARIRSVYNVTAFIGETDGEALIVPLTH
jgi:iron complex transport system ATP-binding protein